MSSSTRSATVAEKQKKDDDDSDGDDDNSNKKDGDEDTNKSIATRTRFYPSRCGAIGGTILGGRLVRQQTKNLFVPPRKPGRPRKNLPAPSGDDNQKKRGGRKKRNAGGDGDLPAAAAAASGGRRGRKNNSNNSGDERVSESGKIFAKIAALSAEATRLNEREHSLIKELDHLRENMQHEFDAGKTMLLGRCVMFSQQIAETKEQQKQMSEFARELLEPGLVNLQKCLDDTKATLEELDRRQQEEPPIPPANIADRRTNLEAIRNIKEIIKQEWDRYYDQLEKEIQSAGKRKNDGEEGDGAAASAGKKQKE